MSTAETVTFSVVGFFALIALLVFARLLLRRSPGSPYRSWRFGVFLEREDNPDHDDPAEADTRSWPSPGVSETGRDR